MSSVKSNEIIEEILKNFRAGADEIYEKIVAPEIYSVYLHVSDYENIVQKREQIIESAKKALSDEIIRRNEAIEIFEKGIIGKSLAKISDIYNRLSGIFRGKPVKKRIKRKYAEPEKGWRISIDVDTENKCQPGDISIESVIEIRKKTESPNSIKMQIMTMKIDGKSIVTQEAVKIPADRISNDFSQSVVTKFARLPKPKIEAFALIHLKTSNGKMTYKMTQNTFTIGRGDEFHRVDLPIINNDKISHEHLRIDRDESSGKFFVKDLSRNGTKLNGKKLPSVIEKNAGQIRENQTRTELADHSTLLLAEEITLEFEILK